MPSLRTSLCILNMFVFVDSVVFVLFLSLSCLESCFSVTFLEILLPSSGKVCECVCCIYVFAEEQNIPIMVSFDVTSLYATIPIDQALLIIRDLLEHDEKLADRTLLSPRQILDVLDILLRTTYFKFNGDFYQQTDRTAMGGPTSAIVSEIYMQSLETTAITTADLLPKV